MTKHAERPVLPKEQEKAIGKVLDAQEEFVVALIALRAAPPEPSHRNDTAACRKRMNIARGKLRDALGALLNPPSVFSPSWAKDELARLARENEGKTDG